MPNSKRPSRIHAFNAHSPLTVDVRRSIRDVDQIEEVFRTGKGLPWGDHHPDLFEGTERFFRPGYLANLTTSWIPSIEGVARRLEGGGQVADVGCGHDRS